MRPRKANKKQQDSQGQKQPEKCVIDTNVPIVANATEDSKKKFGSPCILACIAAIKQVTQCGGLVIDEGDEIFGEYRKKLSRKGEPGVGDGFLKWVHDHGWNETCVARIAITKQGDSYREFPEDNRLQAFDPSDHKFIAVANAHPDKPPILQATDTKWRDFKEVFEEVGIEIRFLCENYMKENQKAVAHKRQ